MFSLLLLRHHRRHLLQLPVSYTHLDVYKRQSQFGSSGQPLYFFIDENGNKLAEESYGFNPDVQKFVNHLEKVKEKYKNKTK